MKYNFDEVINRAGTSAEKVDGMKEIWGRTDLIPLWVADMDFATPPYVINAIRKRCEHPILGYTAKPESYYRAITDWVKRRYGMEIETKHLNYVPGIVPGLGMALNCFTRPEEKVMIMPPVYHPFAWLVRQEVRRNLEYLADRSVIASGVAPRHYQYHLLQAVCSFPEIGLSNHFNFTHLKERIIMMNKKQTNGAAHLKYVLFALPAFALLVAGNVSCTSETKPADEAVQENPEKVAVEAEPGKEQPVPSESSNVTVSVAEVGEGQAIPEASSAEEDILEVAEVMPEFPGGYKALLEFISKNVRYPEEAMKNAWQGRVVLQFVIEKDGAVSNIKVLRSVNETLDNEAMRVIREMPKWTPGKDKGKEVRCKYTIPIVFALK